MKNILKILILLTTLGCSAQNPIKDLFSIGYNNIPGAYYKDIYNVLGNFEGTYVYTNGATFLKIVLEKKLMYHNDGYFRDILIGEYQYIENGVQKVNTLSNLGVTYVYMEQHYISGDLIIKKNSRPFCPDCSDLEMRVRLGFRDPNNNCPATILIRKVLVGTQEALEIKLRDEERYVYYTTGTTPPPVEMPTVPVGEYILLKQ